MPMKRLLSLTFFLLMVCSIQAQLNLPQLGKYVVVGRNLVDDCDITAIKESFETEIYRTMFDSVSNTALITLWKRPGAGIVKNSNYNTKVLYYDLKNQKIKWKKTVNLNDDEIGKIGEYICFEDNEHFSLLDSETGKNKYKLGKNLRTLLYNFKQGWMLCASYNSLLGKSGSIQKIDLNTGEIIWNKETDLDYGLSWLGVINDSIALFVGGGLRGVNFKSGSIWAYTVNTDDSRYLSRKTEFYIGVYSNIKIEDSTSLYFAGKDKVAKLGIDGSVIWENELNPNEMSKSFLGINRNSLLLVNRGCTYGSNYVAPMGAPFFAVYDKSTGVKKYQVDCIKYSNYIIDFYVEDDCLLLLFQNRFFTQVIGKFRISDGKMLASYTPTVTSLDKKSLYYGFVGSKVYAKQDSAWVNLNQKYPKDVFLVNEYGVLQLDQKLQKKQFFEKKDLYVYEREYEGLRFFKHGDETVLVDSLNREVAVIDFDEIFVTESELYCTKGNSLYIINKFQIPFLKKDELQINEVQESESSN